MRELYIIRHGENLPSSSPMNPQEGLSPLGEEQARALSKKLLSIAGSFDRVFSSDTLRTKQTALIAFPEANLEVVKGLQEREWGDWKELGWPIVGPRLNAMSFEERRSFLPPGGESWIGFEARLAEAFSLISQEDFDRAVLFSHMGVMRALLPIIAPNDFTREGLTKVEFDNCEAVRLEENAGGIWTRLEL